MEIFDITQELFGCAVYPGDPAPRREVLLQTAKGDVCNLTALSMCAHNGTHLDAPYHFIENGARIDEVPLSTTVGPAFVAAFEGEIDAHVAEDILARARAAGAGERLLIKGAAVVTESAAEVFCAGGVLLVGNESQTVGPEKAPAAVHRILLGAGVVLLEGVRLAAVPEGAYFLFAAPLLLGGADGAPCRALLIRER